MAVVGIEAMNVFGGTAFLDVLKLVEHRKLDVTRFENLMMKAKAVAMPYEDPVTYGVNAAKPIIDAMSEEEKKKIELLITCTESGIDFGKSMSTYIHDHLGLNRNCRLFEIKQACYAATAGLQTAINFVLSQASPGAKALVIGTDISRFFVAEGGEALSKDWSYAEPSSGAGAVAMLISDTPHIFQVDLGANGYYGYEVMDTCRPEPDSEAGDADLSLLSYLDCCEQTFAEYQRRVDDVDYRSSFQYLAYHTPFGGMVRGAHRNMMRKLLKVKPAEIEEDFRQRVLPGLGYCQQIGNIMGGTLFVALSGIICDGAFDTPKRIGCFSYGSGCCSEFFSGVVTKEGAEKLRRMNIAAQLDRRYPLTLTEYDDLLTNSSSSVRFGTRNVQLDPDIVHGARASWRDKERLVLKEIKEFHRVYEWL
jgi:polyketide biosynthesis 3-hydroxy-3-methylglutaryl-CoA synthase-like enzyme PksG